MPAVAGRLPQALSAVVGQSPGEETAGRGAGHLKRHGRIQASEVQFYGLCSGLIGNIETRKTIILQGSVLIPDSSARQFSFKTVRIGYFCNALILLIIMEVHRNAYLWQKYTAIRE